MTGDSMYILLTCLFFALSFFYASLCGRIKP